MKKGVGNIYAHCRHPKEESKKEVLNEKSKNPAKCSTQKMSIILKIETVVDSRKKETKKDIDKES